MNLKFWLTWPVLLIPWLLIPPLFAQPQEIAFEHISIEQGLSQSEVKCILQDNQGFLWFGTTDGLNKYDGYNFTVYKHDPLDSNSVSDNSITSLYEDQDGILWIGTVTGGLNRFDRKQMKFSHFKHNTSNPKSLSDNYVTAIRESRLDAASGVGVRILWIGTNGGGLNKLVLTSNPDRLNKDSASGTELNFTSYQYDSTISNCLSQNSVTAIDEDRSGILWIGTTGGGLNRFDVEREKFKHYQRDPTNPSSLSHNHVTMIYESIHHGNAVLWAGTFGGGLNRLDRENQVFKAYSHDPANINSLSNDLVTSIYQDHSDILWIGTDGGGVNLFDYEKNEFQSYQHDPANVNSLSYNSVTSVFEDVSDVLWLGTAGLDKFDIKKKRFEHYKNNPAMPNSLSDNMVFSIYEDKDGMLWIGTSTGLDKFDRVKGRLRTYRHDPENPNSLSDDRVFAIYEDQAGSLWLGTNSGGLCKFDKRTERFKVYKHNPSNTDNLSYGRVKVIHTSRVGKGQYTTVLWIGTFGGGLDKFNLRTEQFSHYLLDPANPGGVSNYIMSIFEDPDGNGDVLWIGTNGGGLYKFDVATEKFTHYQHDPANSNSLSHDAIFSIYEDDPDVLWIATYGGGLNRFDRKTGQFTHFTEKDNLPNDAINAMLGDENGNLWISTNNGLSKFSPKTGIFKNYNVNDGLQSNEFNHGAYCKSRNGEMFFGGINGFNAFRPDEVIDNSHIPPIVLTSFKIFDQEVSLQKIGGALEQLRKVTLSYQENYLSFEFAALDFTNPHKNQYAYKLEGLDEDWIYSGTRRFTSYTNLDPGEYIFRVKGSNNDGVWNDEGIAVKIAITPPPWKTWWAYTLYVLVIGGLLYGIRKYELNRMRLANDLKFQRLEAQKLHEVDHMKSRFFANISHEFRTPLTLILGPLESLLQKTVPGRLKEQYAIMLRNCRRLLRLINQLLDLAKLEAGSMTLRARQENVIHLLKLSIASFQSLADRKRITLRFQSAEGSTPLDDSEIPSIYLDRDKFEKIISNLIANAIKFTPEGGSVEVAVGRATGSTNAMSATAAATANWVTVSIHDTGIGIPADQLDKVFDRFYQVEHHHRHEVQGTGIGLALTKELVELHGGEIHVQSEVGKGSTFVVRLPVGKEHLKPEDIVDELAEEEAASALHQAADLQPAEARTVEEKESADGATVLIVEDNPDMRAYLRDILGESYRLMEAGDGEEGLQQAAAAVPDLIVSDVMMPKMGGFEFCHRIKTVELTSHIPVILLTARAAREDKLEGLDTGVDDYVTKPFDAHELRARVKNLIEQRRRLRERFSREITVQPKDIAISTYDERFLARAMEIVEAHISNPDFSTETFAKGMNMSRMQLNRKLQALTGQATGEFVRTMRLKRAAQLLAKKGGTTIVEIAYEVGFNSPAYFAKCFREQFGQVPSEYVRRATEQDSSA